MSNTREITVYSSRGAKKAKIQSDATTWGGLIPLLKKEGYEVDSLHSTIGGSKLDLVHVEAALPEEPFTIFMRPKKTKSGAAKRGAGLDIKGLKELVKEDLANKEFTNAKEHYSGYSSLKIEALRTLVQTFKGKKAVAPKATKATPAKATKTTAKATPAAKKATTPKATTKPASGKGKDDVAAVSDEEETKVLAKEAAELEKGFR